MNVRLVDSKIMMQVHVRLLLLLDIRKTRQELIWSKGPVLLNQIHVRAACMHMCTYMHLRRTQRNTEYRQSRDAPGHVMHKLE